MLIGIKIDNPDFGVEKKRPADKGETMNPTEYVNIGKAQVKGFDKFSPGTGTVPSRGRKKKSLSFFP